MTLNFHDRLQPRNYPNNIKFLSRLCINRHQINHSIRSDEFKLKAHDTININASSKTGARPKLQTHLTDEDGLVEKVVRSMLPAMDGTRPAPERTGELNARLFD